MKNDPRWPPPSMEFSIMDFFLNPSPSAIVWSAISLKIRTKIKVSGCEQVWTLRQPAGHYNVFFCIIGLRIVQECPLQGNGKLTRGAYYVVHGEALGPSGENFESRWSVNGNMGHFTPLFENNKNKIRDLFKVKLYAIRSETEKSESEIEITWMTEITIKYQNLTV